MTAIFGALAPIFLLIVIGWALRGGGVLPDSFWPPAEKLTYYILFPALLLSNLAEAKLAGLPVAGLAGAHAVGILTMAALALAARPMMAHRPFRLDGPGFTSVFQCVIRPNTYVGLAASTGLFGAQGLTLTAICVALAVPLVNLLSVAVMVRHAVPKGGRQPRWREAVLPILRNPLIAACLGGILLNLTGIGLPPVIGPLLKILGAAALPLGLLAVGAGLDFQRLRSASAAVGLASAAKLALLPFLVGSAALAFGVQGVPLAACVAYAGLPGAPNAYVLARQMGGDAGLVAGILTAQTILAAVTLPVLVTLLIG